MNKLKIRKLKIFCPFDGIEMEKYESDKLYNLCYCYCKKCKREFNVGIIQSKDGNSLNFYWKEGDTRIYNSIKKSKKEIKHE